MNAQWPQFLSILGVSFVLVNLLLVFILWLFRPRAKQSVGATPSVSGNTRTGEAWIQITPMDECFDDMEVL